ncbi:unnamed protein product [Amoebophrya sp. A25]|nr:unnamed protein product [Amoebophrya sp. A25]|eukprot:GSA25T00000529001.1
MDVAQHHMRESLAQMRESLRQLEEFGEQYEELETTLESLPLKLKHEAMIPFGKGLFFEGQIEHTNEVVMHLGDSYYAERTVPQALKTIRERKSENEKLIAAQCKAIENLEAEEKLMLQELGHGSKSSIKTSSSSASSSSGAAAGSLNEHNHKPVVGSKIMEREVEVPSVVATSSSATSKEGVVERLLPSEEDGEQIEIEETEEESLRAAAAALENDFVLDESSATSTTAPSSKTKSPESVAAELDLIAQKLGREISGSTSSLMKKQEAEQSTNKTRSALEVEKNDYSPLDLLRRLEETERALLEAAEEEEEKAATTGDKERIVGEHLSDGGSFCLSGAASAGQGGFGDDILLDEANAPSGNIVLRANADDKRGEEEVDEEEIAHERELQARLSHLQSSVLAQMSSTEGSCITSRTNTTDPQEDKHLPQLPTSRVKLAPGVDRRKMGTVRHDSELRKAEVEERAKLKEDENYRKTKAILEVGDKKVPAKVLDLLSERKKHDNMIPRTILGSGENAIANQNPCNDESRATSGASSGTIMFRPTPRTSATNLSERSSGNEMTPLIEVISESPAEPVDCKAFSSSSSPPKTNYREDLQVTSATASCASSLSCRDADDQKKENENICDHEAYAELDAGSTPVAQLPQQVAVDETSPKKENDALLEQQVEESAAPAKSQPFSYSSKAMPRNGIMKKSSSTSSMCGTTNSPDNTDGIGSGGTSTGKSTEVSGAGSSSAKTEGNGQQQNTASTSSGTTTKLSVSFAPQLESTIAIECREEARAFYPPPEEEYHYDDDWFFHPTPQGAGGSLFTSLAEESEGDHDDYSCFDLAPRRRTIYAGGGRGQHYGHHDQHDPKEGLVYSHDHDQMREDINMSRGGVDDRQQQDHSFHDHGEQDHHDDDEPRSGDWGHSDDCYRQVQLHHPAPTSTANFHNGGHPLLSSTSPAPFDDELFNFGSQFYQDHDEYREQGNDEAGNTHVTSSSGRRQNAAPNSGVDHHQPQRVIRVGDDDEPDNFLQRNTSALSTSSTAEDLDRGTANQQHLFQHFGGATSSTASRSAASASSSSNSVNLLMERRTVDEDDHDSADDRLLQAANMISRPSSCAPGPDFQSAENSAWVQSLTQNKPGKKMSKFKLERLEKQRLLQQEQGGA